MEIYHYDPITKEPTKKSTARLDPLETKIQGKDIYLTPANSTTVVPPKAAAKSGTVRRFVSGKWEETVDCRGEEYYLPGDTLPRAITKVGVSIPKGSSPNPPDSIILEKKWREIKGLRTGKTEEPLEHSGNVFQMDRYSRESMAEAIQDLAGEKVEWRLLDNTIVEQSAAQLKNILRKYRKRKLLLSKASWNAEVTMSQIGDLSKVDARSMYEVEISKLRGTNGLP